MFYGFAPLKFTMLSYVIIFMFMMWPGMLLTKRRKRNQNHNKEYKIKIYIFFVSTFLQVCFFFFSLFGFIYQSVWCNARYVYDHNNKYKAKKKKAKRRYPYVGLCNWRILLLLMLMAAPAAAGAASFLKATFTNTFELLLLLAAGVYHKFLYFNLAAKKPINIIHIFYMFIFTYFLHPTRVFKNFLKKEQFLENFL